MDNLEKRIKKFRTEKVVLKMGVRDEIKEFKEKGWDYSGSGLDDSFIICPNGTIYRVEHLRYGCPICDQFLEDNPSLKESFCDGHLESQEEIKDAKKFLWLVDELNRTELCDIFNPNL